MKRPNFLLNVGNLLLCLSLLLAFTLSCTQIKGVAGLNEQTKELNEFYYNVPFGYESAMADPGAWHESSFVILMPDSERIFVGKMDSPPVDIAKLGEAVKAFAADKTPDKKAAYIAAANDVSKEAITRVLDELRKQEIETVRLLVSSAERHKGISGNDTKYEESMGDIPKPDRTMEFALQPEPAGNLPNPLTLVITIDKDREVLLNNESFEKDGLVSKLSLIFKEREMNGIYKEGTNEIYKTVYVPMDNSPTQNESADIKYADIFSILSILKDAGASVLLSNPAPCCSNIFQYGDISSIDAPPKPRTEKPVPKTISGGIINGKAISLPKPPYPPAARAVRASGAVNVQVRVDTNGKVVEAKAVSGHPLLRPAAEQAARMATFSPTILAGTPVNVTGVIVYNFNPE